MNTTSPPTMTLLAPFRVEQCSKCPDHHVVDAVGTHVAVCTRRDCAHVIAHALNEIATKVRPPAVRSFTSAHPQGGTIEVRIPIIPNEQPDYIPVAAARLRGLLEQLERGALTRAGVLN